MRSSSTTALASTSRAAILYGSPFPENLNGTDFVPNYLRRTKHRYRIFLLGAKPGIAERAAHRLSVLCPRHKIVGCRHGHFDRDEASEIVDLIRRSKADLLLVAMGNPKQELFLHEHLAATGCRLGIGVGALFDFLAGDVPRAPLLGCKDGGLNGSIACCRSRAASLAGISSAIRCS